MEGLPREQYGSRLSVAIQHRVLMMRQGFTLIELSIVLVIIGLIVGGVLVGRDLIRAAEVRATISQIEKYNTAVNTFRGKYGALPGDIPDPSASNFGFIARGAYPGQRNGDGILRGMGTGANTSCGFCQLGGETAVFWVDLSAAHLIEGSFNTATSLNGPNSILSGSALDLYFPPAKLGGGNFLYAWSGRLGLGFAGPSDTGNNGINYFGLSQINQAGTDWALYTTPGLTVHQAFAIDKKIGDGFPQSGNVTAYHLSVGYSPFSPVWAAGGGTSGASPGSAATGSSTSCYDNGGNAANPMQYSVQISNGSNVNCALSFQFQ